MSCFDITIFPCHCFVCVQYTSIGQEQCLDPTLFYPVYNTHLQINDYFFPYGMKNSKDFFGYRTRSHAAVCLNQTLWLVGYCQVVASSYDTFCSTCQLLQQFRKVISACKRLMYVPFSLSGGHGCCSHLNEELGNNG